MEPPHSRYAIEAVSSEGEGNGQTTIPAARNQDEASSRMPQTEPAPERHQGRRSDMKSPITAERFVPTIHSSNPKHEQFQFNRAQELQDIFIRAMNEVADDEEIRKSHREPAEAGSEEEQLQQLRDKWFQAYEDMLRPPPPGLPPWREVNHRIPLIEEQKQYRYRAPRCPESVREELSEKISKYVAAKWWEPATVQQAAPLLCVAKKSSKLRTVVDARERNDNTVKDVTPLPDQDQIRMDVARAKYRSKIDLSDAYEQVRIVAQDIWKTAFATPYGTFVSNVMQQGDCNAPATFQRLMTTIFRDYIGRFVHVYLDDIFVYSNSIEEHERHLKLVLDKLHEVQLYMS